MYLSWRGEFGRDAGLPVSESHPATISEWARLPQASQTSCRQPEHGKCSLRCRAFSNGKQVTAVLKMKGRIAADTYWLRWRTSTACQIISILYNRPVDVPQNCPLPWGIHAHHLIHGSLVQPKSISRTAKYIHYKLYIHASMQAVISSCVHLC